MIESERTGILKCIFAAARDAGVSSEMVRESVAPAIIGRRLSCADEAELKRVRAHVLSLAPVRTKPNNSSPLTGRGWVRGGKKRFADLGYREGFASPAQLRLLSATWASHPRVREKTDSALRRFIAAKFKISDFRFVTQDQVGPILAAIKGIR